MLYRDGEDRIFLLNPRPVANGDYSGGYYHQGLCWWLGGDSPVCGVRVSSAKLDELEPVEEGQLPAKVAAELRGSWGVQYEFGSSAARRGDFSKLGIHTSSVLVWD